MPKTPTSDSRTGSTLALVRNGLAAHKAGRLDEAARSYREALVRDPRNPAATHLLGMVHLARQEVSQAVALIAKAVAAEPQNVQYLSNLGVALHAAGREQEALDALNRAVRAKADFAEAHSNRGMVLRAVGRFEEAAEAYKKAIALKPNESAFHFNLGNALENAGDTLGSLRSHANAIRLRPDYYQAHSASSRGYAKMRQYDVAIASARRAVRLAPQEVTPRLNLGQVLRSAGRPQDAAAVFEGALDLNPKSADAMFEIATTRRINIGDRLFGGARSILNDTTAAAEERALAGFGLGRALSDIGEHDESIEVFLMANRLMRSTIDYDVAAAVEKMRSRQEPFKSFDLSGFTGGHRDAAPIFVVGLPRSGKTMVETLLRRDPRVFGAGELATFSQLANRIIGPQPDPSKAGSAAFTELGRAYARQVEVLAPGQRVVDTMPANLPLVGFVRLALPDARIIHCRREPFDHCVALFEKLFRQGGYHYSYDLAELTTYYRAYQQYAEDWRRHLGDSIFDVDTAALRAGDATTVRQLFDFCEISPPESFHGEADIESEPRAGGVAPAIEVAERAAHAAAYSPFLSHLLKSP